MRKQHFLLTFLLLLAVVFFTACGGAAATPTTAPTDVPPTEEQEVATEQAAEAETEAVEEASEVATEEMTEEASEAATEEMAETEATEVAMAEMTESATEDAAMDATEAAAALETVCLVTDVGRVDDGTFNQFAYEGMLRAASDFDLETTVIETVAQADYEENIQTCINEDYDVIITVGFLIEDATYAAALANPDTYFIAVDQGFFGKEMVPNVVGIQYREDQAGFLVGALAVLMSESNVIGGVYGVEIPPVVKFRHGYEQGARYMAGELGEEVRILGVYIDSFTAPDRGAAAAAQIIGEGADVIFGAGGQTGSGGIRRAAELGAWVIGVDQDEYFTTFGSGETPGADRLISSALKRVDVGVYDMLGALSGGGQTWLGGGLYILEAANNGVGFAEAHDAAVPQEVTDQVQAIFEMLASGELDTGVDPGSGALVAPIGDLATVEDVVEATPEATPAMDATEEATPEATPGS